jgi:hypothetical protein
MRLHTYQEVLNAPTKGSLRYPGHTLVLDKPGNRRRLLQNHWKEVLSSKCTIKTISGTEITNIEALFSYIQSQLYPHEELPEHYFELHSKALHQLQYLTERDYTAQKVMIFLEGTQAELCQQLFLSLRNQLWELPFTWILFADPEQTDLNFYDFWERVYRLHAPRSVSPPAVIIRTAQSILRKTLRQPPEKLVTVYDYKDWEILSYSSTEIPSAAAHQGWWEAMHLHAQASDEILLYQQSTSAFVVIRPARTRLVG